MTNSKLVPPAFIAIGAAPSPAQLARVPVAGIARAASPARGRRTRPGRAASIARDMGLGLLGFAGGIAILTGLARMEDEAARAATAVPDAAALLAEEPAPVPAARRPIARARDGLFYVHARINGQRVRFLVDTGATHVTLTAADARRIGATPDTARRASRIETAAGTAAMRWARLDHVSIAGHEARDVPAAIMPGGLGVSLLGQDMLAQLGPIAIEGDRMRIG